MVVTTGTLTACTGGDHLTLPVTINSITRNLEFTRGEMLATGPDTHEEVKPALLARLRSAILEATTGTPTALQVRNAVSGKTFEI